MGDSLNQLQTSLIVLEAHLDIISQYSSEAMLNTLSDFEKMKFKKVLLYIKSALKLHSGRSNGTSNEGGSTLERLEDQKAKIRELDALIDSSK